MDEFQGNETSFLSSAEIESLIEVISNQYGYDFQDYREASFKRRLLGALVKYGLKDISEVLQKILEPDSTFFLTLLNDLTVTVSELFRDPIVYRVIQEKVFPHLSTYPEIKIWFAGCAGGEEVYSLAILLEENGLYDRSILYGTDINPAALQRAMEGMVSLASLKTATENYFEAGGKESLHSYYETGDHSAILRPGLRRHMVFSSHSLVSDEAFGEMQLIFCRNTLIYFKKALQDRSIRLFKESLSPGGFLCLGTKESLTFSSDFPEFEEFSKAERIYRRKRSRRG